MHLVKIYLPLNDPDGHALPSETHDRVKQKLTAKFGGVTMFSNAPAEGLWAHGEKLEFDQIIVFEVLTKVLSYDWWKDYRKTLESVFQQDQIIISTHTVDIL